MFNMLRQARRILSASSSLIQPRARYQNYVFSDALSQIERECEQYCPVPRFPPQKVNCTYIIEFLTSDEKEGYYKFGAIVTYVCLWPRLRNRCFDFNAVFCITNELPELDSLQPKRLTLESR